MKPKEYVKKLELEHGWNRSKQNELFSYLSQELSALCDYLKADDNLGKFNSAVDQVRSKFNGISNKIPYGIPEVVWNYFYKVAVVPMRNITCPRQVKMIEEAKERAREERKKRAEFRRKMEDEFRAEFEREKLILSMLVLSSFPLDSYKLLGLALTATEDDIRSAYRKKAVYAHPDHGGSQEDFIKLTEAKNNCLKWVTMQ